MKQETLLMAIEKHKALQDNAVNNCMPLNQIIEQNGQIPRNTQTTKINSRRNRKYE